MIQANELRIGNYLHDRIHREINVSEIRPDHLVFHLSNENKIKHNIKTFKPIPLTEQWLVDFGFERGLGWDDEQYYVIRFGNTEFFIYVNNDGYESDYNHNITTVHHLQNLCYFATGNELVKIKN